MATVVIGIATGMTGVYLLFASWRGRLAAPTFAVSLGWTLLTASMYVWILLDGVEFGIVYGLVTPALYAWLLILFSVERRRSGSPDYRPVVNRRPTRKGLVRNLSLFLVAVPLLAIVSSICAVAVGALMPTNRVNQTVLAVFLMPVIWGSMAFWACSDPKPVRPFAWSISLAVIGSTLLYRLSAA
jgi:hypothetical protein